jgi:REP-associated tyrosine transposase
MSRRGRDADVARSAVAETCTTRPLARRLDGTKTIGWLAVGDGSIFRFARGAAAARAPAASRRPVDVRACRIADGSGTTSIAPHTLPFGSYRVCRRCARRTIPSRSTCAGDGVTLGFRVLHFSVQADHLHLLVEADRPTGLARGIQGLAIRVAKAINRVLGRHGAVWGDRNHARKLGTPREVRNALVYILDNWRKHVPGARGVDARSSAGWFDGWRSAVPRRDESPPVASPRTWLARIGWRRHGAPS